jgi:hypothetical protein
MVTQAQAELKTFHLFLFLVLFLKDSHKYASGSKISKNGPSSWRHCYWRQDQTSRRQPNWRQAPFHVGIDAELAVT